MRKYLAATAIALAALIPAACLPNAARPPAQVPAPACAYPRHTPTAAHGACPRLA